MRISSIRAVNRPKFKSENITQKKPDIFRPDKFNKTDEFVGKTEKKKTSLEDIKTKIRNFLKLPPQKKTVKA